MSEKNKNSELTYEELLERVEYLEGVLALSYLYTEKMQKENTKNKEESEILGKEREAEIEKINKERLSEKAEIERRLIEKNGGGYFKDGFYFSPTGEKYEWD